MLGVAMVPVLLAGCVMVTTDNQVSTGWSKDSTILYLEVPTRKMRFNWHGGGVYNESESFTITVPRGQMSFRGAEILATHGRDATALRVHPDSQVAFASRCAVSVHVLDEQGKPYPFNGKYDLSSWDCLK